MQKILTEKDADTLKSINKYAVKVNDELSKMGLPPVRNNLIYQVIGGHHSNSDIEIAAKRVVKQYQDLISEVSN